MNSWTTDAMFAEIAYRQEVAQQQARVRRLFRKAKTARQQAETGTASVRTVTPRVA